MPKNSATIGFKLPLMQEYGSLLAQLPAETGARVAGTATEQAMKPMVSAVRAKAQSSRRTGALQKSITSVVRIYSKQGKVVGIMGPDKNARFLGGRKISRGGKKLAPDRPSKYAHLVEFGHYSAAATGAKLASTKGRTIRKGTLTAKSWVMAQPFMRPGVASSEAAVAGKLADGIAAGLAKENQRIVNKMNRSRNNK
jgi:hypothetical protein